MKRLLATFQGPDGKTALIACQASATVGTFLGLSVWSFARGGGAFDMTTFATAGGMVLTASAAAIAGHAWGQAKAQAIPAAPDAPAGSGS